MTVTVEDGTGIEDANSYVSADDAETYCENHGLSSWTSSSDDDAKEAALIRASAAIDARYGACFPGTRLKGRDQGLQWPRLAAYDISGWLIGDKEVPVEVINATIEAAVRELATPNSLMPDLERGGQIQSIRAGSVGIIYANGAPARTTFILIDGILANVLNGMDGSGGGLFGRAVRG
jgi:hypothetical protein